VTLKSRLAKVEWAVSLREPRESGPLALLVKVDADGRGHFAADGKSYEIDDRAELDAWLAARGWRPSRVIFVLPGLRDCPGAEARFRSTRRAS
jgi:hypothetical protein